MQSGPRFDTKYCFEKHGDKNAAFRSTSVFRRAGCRNTECRYRYNFRKGKLIQIFGDDFELLTKITFPFDNCE